MKKTLLAAAALIAALVSCQKEMEAPEMDLNENRLEQNDRFMVSLEGTKATIDDSLQVRWAEGDSIRVNGVIYELAEFYEDSTRAEFKKRRSEDITPTAPFNACFPADWYDESTMMLSVPDTIYRKDSEDFSMPMFAQSNTRTMAFNNVGGVLAISVSKKEAASVKVIKVEDESETIKTVICNDAVTPDSTGTTFYVSVEPGSYQSLTVGIYANEGDEESVTEMFSRAANGIEIQANTLYAISYKTSLKGITLSKQLDTLNIGAKDTLTITCDPINATNKEIEWESTADSIATVDAEGRIEAIKEGETLIIATSKEGAYKDTCKLTVCSIPVDSVVIAYKSINIAEGKDSTIKAKVWPENASLKKVNWSSLNETVATVDSTGKISGLADGTAKIVAEVGGKTDTCTVTVRIINIYTKAGLQAFAQNASLYEAGEWVTLCADIDFEGGEWTTSGDFAGNFDGKGHSIYNLVIKANSDNDKAGLIGTVKGSAQFKDLILGYNPDTEAYDGISTVTTVNGSSEFNVGTLAATVEANNAKFENITNYIPVTVTTTEPSTALNIEYRVGGILGAINGGKAVSVKKCKNCADININHIYRIKSDAYLSGITGLVSGDDCVFDGCENQGAVKIPSIAIYGNIYMGGIIGRLGLNNQGLKIQGCVNNGELSDLKNNGSDHQPYIAGIIAADNDFVSSDTLKMTVLKCVNNGNIQCISQSGGLHLGGIVALMKANSLIDQCINNGTIYKNGNCANEDVYVGGILGRGAAPSAGNALVSNCVNEGVVKGTNQTSKITLGFGGIVGSSYIEIKDCTNNGGITTEGTGNGALCLGGIVGVHANGAPITGCENFGNVTLSNEYATSACGGLVGLQCNAETRTFEGCTVNCKVSGDSTKCGMVLGNFNANTPVFVCGTELNPVSVKGSFNDIQITSENLNTYLFAGTNANATFNVKLLSK